ncbi:MAG: succinylglutamate desuccinylase [Xanthomonadales bacterium]|nr:succinylglutamate desuccinylase [Xanthomonadales bacterium]
MQVQVINGRRAGPVMFVSAAVHGDELNGVEIIRRLLKMKALKSLRGTLLAVPVVNIHGFLDQSRYLPDRRDLNRSFPGSPKGSIAARLAHTFVEHVVRKAAFGIDLHTGAVDRANLPQIRANLGDDATRDIALAFGAPVVVDASVREGSLRACAAESGMPMLVYEAGEALRFDELSIRAGLRGVIRVMRNIGMLPAKRATSSVEPVIAKSSGWMRAPASGIVTGMVRLGQSVRKGEVIARVSDPLGEQETDVPSRFDGIVIGLSRLPLAHEGDALVHVAAFSDVEQAEGAVEDFNATHDPALGRTVETELIGT